jgi:hypothetical protein
LFGRHRGGTFEHSKFAALGTEDGAPTVAQGGGRTLAPHADSILLA